MGLDPFILGLSSSSQLRFAWKRCCWVHYRGNVIFSFSCLRFKLCHWLVDFSFKSDSAQIISELFYRQPFKKNWAIPGLFFFIFRLFWIAMTEKYNWIITMPMSGIALRISGVGSDRSANWATTAAPIYRQPYSRREKRLEIAVIEPGSSWSSCNSFNP